MTAIHSSIPLFLKYFTEWPLKAHTLPGTGETDQSEQAEVPALVELTFWRGDR